MKSRIAYLTIVFSAVSLLSISTALAADTDPGDLAFWQSIQNSTNPAEFQAYLNAFPNGRFAPLARIRAAAAGAPTPVAPAAPMPPTATVAAKPAPAGDDLGPIVGDGTAKITVQPTTARVGQKLTISFSNFPDPNSDYLFVVTAGTPDFDPAATGYNEKSVFQATLYNPTYLKETLVGPFAPGKYEIRYMTHLYNNVGRYEVSARTSFTVR